ncbi:MAG: O-methyltransferase [Candidatus Micrarchaeales archaeon]
MGGLIIPSERQRDKAVVKRSVFELVRKMQGPDKSEEPHWKIYPEGLVIPPQVSVDELTKLHSVQLPANTEHVLSRLEALSDSWAIKQENLIADDQKIWLPDGVMRLWQIPRRTGIFLNWLVKETQSRNILELGTSGGYSGIWLAMGAKQNGGTLYTVDLSPTKIEMAHKNFEEAGVNNIVQIKGEIRQILRGWDEQIDFVFLDADKVNYSNYLRMILPKLKVGGWVVADNAVDYIQLMEGFVELLRNREHAGSNLYSYILDLDKGLYLIRKDEPIDNRLIASFFNSSTDFF